MKHWAMNHDKCQSCGTTTIPHHGKGLCRTCYFKQYHRENPPRHRGELERFTRALPDMLFRLTGTRFPVSYDNGTITIRKLGTKTVITWPEE